MSPVKVDDSKTVDGWTIKRLKDEKIDGVICEVYEAKQDPLSQTTWLNLKDGYVVKRKTTQNGGMGDLEIIRERIK